MKNQIFEIDRHEKINSLGWDKSISESWIKEILSKSISSFDEKKLWEAHDLDQIFEVKYDTFYDPYFGASGIIWTLYKLASKYGHKFNADDAIDVTLNRYLKCAGDLSIPDSYFFGELGIRTLKEVISPDDNNLNSICDIINQYSEQNNKNEIMYGQPGFLLSLCSLVEVNASLKETLTPLAMSISGNILAAYAKEKVDGYHCWEQALMENFSRRYLGLMHGYGGNIVALQRTSEIFDLSLDLVSVKENFIKLLKAKILTDDNMSMANWPKFISNKENESGQVLVHICHGSPGILLSLLECFDLKENDEIKALSNIAAKSIFEFGALKKGPNLCHGTSGNALPFLSYYQKTKEKLWLEYAREFGMHSIIQSKEMANKYGDLRYSLWTGDLGLAVFLDQCISEDFYLPFITSM